MAVTYGFFNSVSGDRLYNADQMSTYFEGLVTSGVFENVGDRLQVTAGTGMSVNVGTGRAIVSSKWVKNDATLNFAITAADVQKNRIDAIAIRFDATARTVSIVVKEGTATTGAATPPTRATGADVYELFLAYVSVPKATTAITQDLITDLRWSANCGWVTGLIKQVNTSDLYDQWAAAYNAYYEQSTAAFNTYLATKQAEFNTWFASLTEQLNVDTTLHQYQNTVTASNGATEVSIGISEYDSNADLLLAYIGGVFLVQGVDYTISGTGDAAKIQLVRALVGVNDITFVVIKSVIGEGAAGVFQVSVELVSGGYNNNKDHAGSILGYDDTWGAEHRCRLKYQPYLPAGTYTVALGPTADNDLQMFVGQAGPASVYGDIGMATTVAGSWSTSFPVIVTLSEPGYLIVSVGKLDSETTITPAAAGGYVIIRKSTT